MTRRIVVDDADDAIRYSSGWYTADVAALNAQGDYGPVYGGTTHGTTTHGSSVSFGFQGTTLQVMGTLAITQLADGSYDPSWSCTVDGTPISNPDPTFAYPENNWVLCNAASLSSGQHTLEITVSTKGTPFYLDNILYTPTVDPTTVHGAVLEYLNTDEAVSYSEGTWVEWGVQNMTQTTGASATLSFTGTAVTLLGSIPANFPTSATTATYTIDSSSPQTIPLAGLTAGSTINMYNQVIVQADNLAAGQQHALVVTYEGGSGFTPLPVQVFYVTNAGDASGSGAGASSSMSVSGSNPDVGGHSSEATTARASGSGSALSPSGFTDTVTVSISGALATAPTSGSGSPSTSNSSSHASSHSHSALIAGVVVGVLAVFGLLLGLCLWHRRRRRQTQRRAPRIWRGEVDPVEMPKQQQAQVQAEPFIVSGFTPRTINTGALSTTMVTTSPSSLSLITEQKSGQLLDSESDPSPVVSSASGLRRSARDSYLEDDDEDPPPSYRADSD